MSANGRYGNHYYHAKIGDAQMRLGFWQAKHSAALAEIHCQSNMARCAMDQIKMIQEEIESYRQMMMGRDVAENAKAGTNDQEAAKDTPNDHAGDREADQASVPGAGHSKESTHSGRAG